MPLFGDWEGPLARNGLRPFSMEHRLPPDGRGGAAVEDVIAAIRYLKRNARRFGFPADKIALIGFSSGGHLALMASLSLAKIGEGVTVVSFYAPLELGRLYEKGNREIRSAIRNYIPVTDDENVFDLRLKMYSPSYHLHEKAKPILLVHGRQDRLVPVEQSRLFYEQAKSLGLDVRLIVVPNGKHNFNMSRSRWARKVEERSIQFVTEHL